MDLISRQAAIDLIKNDAFWVQYAWGGRGHKPEMEMVDDLVESIIKQMKESVMSRLKQMPSAQPEIVRCKDCKHFHYDMPYVIQGFPVLGHEVCDFWGDGCKTSENGFCSYAERRTDETD